MTTVTIQHGRRKGYAKTATPEKTTEVTQTSTTRRNGSKPALLITASDWNRIKQKVDEHKLQVTRAEEERSERKAKHETSKNMVKTWDNTLEGQRLLKLERLKIKAEREEAERVKMDIEEERLRHEQRKAAIAKAKQLVDFQMDHAKKFHESLVLSEVLREREAQIEFKKRKAVARRGMDDIYLQKMRADHEQAILDDQEQARVRIAAAADVRNFQMKQMAENLDKLQAERQRQLEEQKVADEIAEQFKADQRAYEEKLNKEKQEFKVALGQFIDDQRLLERQRQYEDELDDEEVRKFAETKRRMVRMRRQKEADILKSFQKRQDDMCQRLKARMDKAVTDEDERIRIAQEEAYAKRDKEAREKAEQFAERQKRIQEHRVEVIAAHEQQRKKEEEEIMAMARKKREADRQFHIQQLKEEAKVVAERKEVQQFQVDQVRLRYQKEEEELEAKLDEERSKFDKFRKQEEDFQEYTQKVIAEARERGAPTFVLERAAKAGACGGHGPVFDGLTYPVQPSYMSCDTHGVELPGFGKSRLLPGAAGRGKSITREATQHIGTTKKRMGYTLR